SPAPPNAPRSAETTPAPAPAARNTRTATAPDRKKDRGHGGLLAFGFETCPRRATSPAKSTSARGLVSTVVGRNAHDPSGRPALPSRDPPPARRCRDGRPLFSLADSFH